MRGSAPRACTKKGLDLIEFTSEVVVVVVVVPEAASDFSSKEAEGGGVAEGVDVTADLDRALVEETLSRRFCVWPVKEETFHFRLVCETTEERDIRNMVKSSYDS